MMMRMSVHSLCPAGMSPKMKDGTGTGACGKRGNLRQWFPSAEGYKEERPGVGIPFCYMSRVMVLNQSCPGTLSNIWKHFGGHTWLREGCFGNGNRPGTLAPSGFSAFVSFGSLNWSQKHTGMSSQHRVMCSIWPWGPD